MACFRASVIKLSCGWVCHGSLIVATYLCPSLTAHWDRTPKTLWTIKQERKPEITETKYETFHSSQSEVFCSEILAASLQSPVLPEAEQPYQPLVLLPHKTFKVMIRLTEFVVRSLNKVHVVHASISMWAQTHISVGESNCLVSASFVKQDHGMDLQTFGQRTCSWQNSCMSMYGLFAPQNEMLVKPLETSLNTPPILHAAYSMPIPHSNARLNWDLRRALLDLSINCCFSDRRVLRNLILRAGNVQSYNSTCLLTQICPQLCLAPIDASDLIVDNDMSTLGRLHCCWHQRSQGQVDNPKSS